MEHIISGICPAASGQSATLLGGVITTIIGLYCSLSNSKMWPQDVGPNILKNGALDYDFIVVGSGSAGSVVAGRLSEVSNWRVLLIEAGGMPTPDSQIPSMLFNLQRTEADWGYETEENPAFCQGIRGKRCYWPRGKMLGGTSAINAMLYVRGNKADYDEWETLGNTGWNYESVLKYFKKSENLNADRLKNDEKLLRYHGTEGTLNVEDFPEDDVKWRKIMKSAWEYLGKPISKDVNGKSQMGLFEVPGTVKSGQRCSTARSHLQPAKDRTNLDVLYNSQVLKVVIDENTKQATGVRVKVGNSEEITINAKKEVIVSGGTINSPQLLMLSGIGPKSHLEKVGIKVLKDSPVGENLQDHVFFPVFFRTNKNILPEMKMDAVMSLATEYFLTNKGVLGGLRITDMVGFINTLNDKSEIPDVQYHYLHFLKRDALLFPAVIHGIGYDEEVSSKMKEANDENDLFAIYPTLLRPESKGRILLKSNNPLEKPLIYPNFFSNDEDVKTLLRGIRFVEKLEQTPVFKDAGLILTDLGMKYCADFAFKSDDYWRCIIQYLSTVVYHPVGTVKMGPSTDKDAVIDPRLRVYGIKGLRVIDASIMPNIVRGNTNAPTIMIGEKGSDLIKEDWSQSQEKHTEL